MSNVQALPGIFPLQEDRNFLTEREWTCLRLICHDHHTIADSDPIALSVATAGQIAEARAKVLIDTARIALLPGLGTWISRLMAEAGWDETAVRTRPAKDIMEAVNRQAGYAICNPATVHALSALQERWRGNASLAGA